MGIPSLRRDGEPLGAGAILGFVRHASERTKSPQNPGRNPHVDVDFRPLVHGLRACTRGGLRGPQGAGVAAVPSGVPDFVDCEAR